LEKKTTQRELDFKALQGQQDFMLVVKPKNLSKKNYQVLHTFDIPKYGETTRWKNFN
jgi:hypothetical protein